MVVLVLTGREGEGERVCKVFKEHVDGVISKRQITIDSVSGSELSGLTKKNRFAGVV